MKTLLNCLIISEKGKHSIMSSQGKERRYHVTYNYINRLYVEFMRPPHHVQVMSSLGDAVVPVYTALKMK